MASIVATTLPRCQPRKTDLASGIYGLRLEIDHTVFVEY